MQTIGIVLISVGIWIAYCAVYGIPPIQTFTAIIRSPEEFRQIIADARAKGLEEYQAVQGLFAAVAAPVVGEGGNPFSGYKITADWKAHKARSDSNLGGVDYAMPVGTPLPTPFGGTVTNLPSMGTAGDVVRVTLDNGYKLEFYHVSKFTRPSNSRVTAGTVVALSGGAKGAKGAGNSTGPHVHIHMINPAGSRIDYLEYIKGGAK